MPVTPFHNPDPTADNNPASRCENECLRFLKTNTLSRHQFIDKLLAVCEPSDLIYLSRRVDDYKRDFISLLPIEVVESVLRFLDWRTILNCCQVNRTWNHTISKSFNRMWYNLILEHVPLDKSAEGGELNFEADSRIKNYKSLFVDLMNKSMLLQTGGFFASWQIRNLEINAISSYKNIVATATHVAKFWKFEKAINNIELNPQKDWLCFKSMQLQSRAANFKFDDKYMVVSTYFLTVDLYSLQSNHLLCQYMGHTCSITSFDFNQRLMLIVSGSADNTVKYWSMHLDEASLLLPKESASPKLAGSFNGSFNQTTQHIIEGTGNSGTGLLIKTEHNLNWAVQISIQKYEATDRYLLIVLQANGLIFLNMIDKFDDFVVLSVDNDSPLSINGGNSSNTSPINVSKHNELNRFNFKYKLRISDTFKTVLSIQNAAFGLNNQGTENNGFFDDENTENLLVSNKSWARFDASTKLLTVHIVSENNSNQSNKFFIKKWQVKMSERYGMFDAKSVDDDANEISRFSFLNKLSLKSLQINQFEIISFGSNFCIFLDEDNNFYLSNLRNKTIRCIQSELKFDKKTTKAFRLMSSNTHEQFIFSNRDWMNGFKALGAESDEYDNYLFDNVSEPLVCAFYTQKRNELFIIGWK